MRRPATRPVPRRAAPLGGELTPEDVSCAQIYDAFSPLIPLSLEGYGFCEQGEGVAFTEDSGIDGIADDSR